MENNVKVIRELGSGKFGSVWLVCQNEEKLVMKKILLTNLSKFEREKACQEVQILSSLKHPNVVLYKGFYMCSDYLMIYMRYCNGGDLYQLIKKQNGLLFPELKVIRWFIQITMALQYIHGQSVIHRDLKTKNLFLTKAGLIKVGDFGIAKQLKTADFMIHSFVGTPFYMSPEALSGFPYNEKTDIWALGCCLYELLTLNHPFHSKDLCSLMDKISSVKIEKIPNCYGDCIKDLIRCLLSLQPENRPSAEAILRQNFIRLHVESFLSDTELTEKSIAGEGSIYTYRKYIQRRDRTLNEKVH